MSRPGTFAWWVRSLPGKFRRWWQHHLSYWRVVGVGHVGYSRHLDETQLIVECECGCRERTYRWVGGMAGPLG